MQALFQFDRSGKPVLGSVVNGLGFYPPLTGHRSLIPKSSISPLWRPRLSSRITLNTQRAEVQAGMRFGAEDLLASQIQVYHATLASQRFGIALSRTDI